jgi:hypothetical protein
MERTYRERRPLNWWPAVAVLVVGVAAALLVLVWAGRWGVLVGLALALVSVLAAAATVWFGPVPGGRRTVVVGDRGLTVRGGPGAGDHPWGSVRVDRLPAGGRFGWALVPCGGPPVYFVQFGGGASLLRAARTGRVEPVPVARLILAGTAAVAALGLLAVFVVLPRVGARHERHLPDGVAGLARVCDDPGVAFTTAAPYTGSGPHPIAVFDAPLGSRSRYLLATLPGRQTGVGSVQLVACARRHTLDTSAVCQDGSAAGVPTARYTVRVYEVRTHREVATRELTGDCDGDPRAGVGVFLAGITPDQYERDLGDLISG